jgi:leucyl-tRNA---protein transferase
MAYIQLKAPIAPAVMDELLKLGCYRMQQAMFTTNSICVENGQVFRVLWVRIPLKNFTPGTTHKKLMRQCSRFKRVLLDKMVIDDEMEDLYSTYRNSLDFDAAESVTACLLGQHKVNFFPGRTWKVYDGDTLIAGGYFDLGEESAAGILNFYHPDYKKFSLGKWLYFETIRYTAESGRDFFYPGYIAPGYPKFDYKLLAGKDVIELWDIKSARWVSYYDFFL